MNAQKNEQRRQWLRSIPEYRDLHNKLIELSEITERAERNNRVRKVCVMVLLAMATFASVTVLAVKADAQEQGTMIMAAESQVQSTALEYTPPEGYADFMLPEDLRQVVKSCCERQGVEEALVLGVIYTESRGLNVENRGCIGPMQLQVDNESYFTEHTGLQNITETQNNIAAGIWYIGKLLEANGGEVEKALMAYNEGQTKANKMWEDGVRSTRYTHKVLDAMEALR